MVREGRGFIKIYVWNGEKMYLISVYIPETHLEIVKYEMFKAGAGRYNNYDCCSWETKGTGQFRPLDGSKPFIGQNGIIEKVEEYRVEMICTDDIISNVIKALIASHPYEEPAYNAVKILTGDDFK